MGGPGVVTFECKTSVNGHPKVAVAVDIPESNPEAYFSAAQKSSYMAACVEPKNPTLATGKPQDTRAPLSIDVKSIEVLSGKVFKCKDSAGKVWIIQAIGYDTPENKAGDSFMQTEQTGWEKSRDRVKDLLSNAKSVTVYLATANKYNCHDLGFVKYVDKDGAEHILGVELVNEGLAYKTIPFYGCNGRDQICYDFVSNTQAAPTPQFTPSPSVFRKVPGNRVIPNPEPTCK